MKPASFAYHRAGSVDAVLETLARHGGEARVLAGGQSLVAMLNMRLARPSVLVDIMAVESLRNTTLDTDHLVVTAGVRQAALASRDDLRREVPLLAAALPWVGHYQTRTRGTICGSIAHADPSAELPLVLSCLGGEVRLCSRRGLRRIPAAEFFTGPMLTARQEDEIIEAVAFPRARSDTRYAFAEMGRRHGDFAIVACAAMVDDKHMRLAVGGVADMPVAKDLPLLHGDDLADALNEFAWSLPARGDIHATPRYRRDLVRVLGHKVLTEARA